MLDDSNYITVAITSALVCLIYMFLAVFFDLAFTIDPHFIAVQYSTKVILADLEVNSISKGFPWGYYS